MRSLPTFAMAASTAFFSSSLHLPVPSHAQHSAPPRLRMNGIQSFSLLMPPSIAASVAMWRAAQLAAAVGAS